MATRASKKSVSKTASRRVEKLRADLEHLSMSPKSGLTREQRKRINEQTDGVKRRQAARRRAARKAQRNS